MAIQGRTADKWDGGYIRRDSRDRATYYIRRRIGGVLYEVSTRCHTSRAAHEQLRRFEADPANYTPGNDAGDAIVLDEALAAQFLAWSKAKGNTTRWLRDQRSALAWWAEQLGPKANLRGMPTSRLVKALDDAPGRKAKIATLKALCGWLVRERHTMARHEDPSAGLVVPQSRPEQWTTPKAASLEAYRATREHLAQPWQDCLDVLAGTGWHFSELERFAAAGSVEPHPMVEGAEVLACPRTKRGEPIRTEVSVLVAAAARRVLKVGELDYWAFHRELEHAGKKAGLTEVIRPGHLRHSVATWAINKGASPGDVAAFLNHKSARTTQRFYATHAVAAKVPTLA